MKDNNAQQILELRRKIEQIQKEITKLDGQKLTIPELINSTNTLRMNEHLTKINDKKSELLRTYQQYTDVLKEVIVTIIKKQNEIIKIRENE